MTYINKLANQLEQSHTSYHAIQLARQELMDNGFVQIDESSQWNIRPGDKCLVIRDGSALIAFTVGNNAKGFNIVASHTDSPCLKVKANPELRVSKYTKLNVERYGGGLNYSWLDIPLRLAGRVIVKQDNGTLQSHLVDSKQLVVIPSLAIHFNRESNNGLTLNPQSHLSPLVSMQDNFMLDIMRQYEGKEVLGTDIYVTSAVKPFINGYNDEFLSAPRIDNLTSAFASVSALINSQGHNISMTYLADNEEVGSSTKQGAGSTFLKSTISRICRCLNYDKQQLLANSIMVSCDNAHAVHPNYAEKSDPTNAVLLNGGVVIKHHANQNYTTDAFSSALIKDIALLNNIPTQDFYMRADMPCGGTLGAISSQQLSIRSVDIGLPQLAMHSAVETCGTQDYDNLIKLMSIFFGVTILCPTYDTIRVQA
ncbi:MAG: M18 family aminopeptidase [Clostridia bacterium]|nr:M18 family aminopeptidase [Clostridia bacterium]